MRGSKWVTRLLASGVVLALATSVAASESCRSLFDGESLAGWTALGPATYEVVHGAIRGTPVESTDNSFLATNELFGDFELRLQFRYEAGMFNSGVQFRKLELCPL